MTALGDADDPMILALEWTARVNDHIGSNPRERPRQVAVDVDRMGFGGMDGPNGGDEGLRLGDGTSADQQPDFGIACEAARGREIGAHSHAGCEATGRRIASEMSKEHEIWRCADSRPDRIVALMMCSVLTRR
jgi:hypothetical protein